MADPVILHLTDLHFGREIAPADLAVRKLVLKGLVVELEELTSEWRPSIVCVTGDIGWRGATSDYASAKTWLEELLSTLGLSFSDVFACPGNHDTNRVLAKTLGRPGDAVEADELLNVPIARHYLDCFNSFSTFCQGTGIHPYKFNGVDSYLMGEAVFRGIRFVASNSAWFSKDDRDKNKLWIGLPHLRVLEAAGQLTQVEGRSVPPTVVLVHHPPDWWHEHETQASLGRRVPCRLSGSPVCRAIVRK